MSAAATRQVLIVPEVKVRFWSTGVIVLVDVLALEAALLLACFARIHLQAIFPIALGTAQFQGIALGLLTLPLVYYLLGLYPGFAMGAVERLRARVSATGSVFILLLTWNYVFQDRQWSRGVLVLTFLFAGLLVPALEIPTRKFLLSRGVFGLPVLLLGAGETGELVAKRLQKKRDLGLLPLGILDDDPAKWGTQIHGVSVLGPISAAHTFAGRVPMAIIAMPNLGRERLTELIQGLCFPHIVIIPNWFDVQSLWITSRDFGGILGLDVKKNLLVTSNWITKRVLDYAIAIPLFLLSVPFVAICAGWIKLISPGPAFFRQQREGKGGRPITVLKLRTMYPDAECVLPEHLESHPEDKATWLRCYKLKHDPRVLPVIGWFLRKYSLDELPQLWNVLCGDMSLVGPRPLPYYHLNSFSGAFLHLRKSVMPGVTGLWQVSERSDGDLSVQEMEDTYYIRNWSLWLDLYILLRTVKTLLIPNGAY